MEPDKPEQMQYRPDTEAGTCRKRSIISFAGNAEIAFGLLPNRPDSGSGPDPCGLAASSRCVFKFPAHSEKGPEKKSCYSGAGVRIKVLQKKIKRGIEFFPVSFKIRKGVIIYEIAKYSHSFRHIEIGRNR